MKKTTVYKVIVLILLVGNVCSKIHSQEQPGLRTRADQLFQRLEYYNAAQLYERLAQSKRPKTSDFERLAESYYRIGQYELAENWYARAAQQEDFSKAGLLTYAEVLKMNTRYAEAKVLYERYEREYGVSNDITLAILGADSAQYWLSHPTGHKLTNELNVNTDLSEFGAIPTSGGVVYAGEPKIHGNLSGMTGRAYLRIFSASRDRLGEINNPAVMSDIFNDARYHVGPIAANAEENVLYVTRTHPGTQLEKFREGDINWRKVNLELKMYTKSEGGWVETDFPYNNTKEYSLGHATLSEDGNVLYYASNMPGGYGGVDIWYSELQSDGSWGIPKNAGPVVNSDKDEMFPSILNDTLYYSSNGFVGMGGLDIYKVSGSRDKFSGRENLGHPLNSAADDFAYVSWFDVEDNHYGYLSSNRQGGVGGDDIYSFSRIKPRIKIILQGITKNKETNELLPNALVTLFGANNNVISKRNSDEQASFEFLLDKDMDYKLLGEKPGFYADSLSISSLRPTKDTTIHVVLKLQPVYTVGTKFVLENLYYDFDKHNIRPDAAKVLDEVVRVMRDNPTLKIELSSHTDSRGSDAYNLQLSQRRADSAVSYIISRGIAKDRLVAKGYGESRLVNNCSNGVPCSVEQHQANRRTEIEVLEF